MGSNPSQYMVPEGRRSSGLVLREAVDENRENEEKLKMYQERQIKEILKTDTGDKPGLVLRKGRQEDNAEDEGDEDEDGAEEENGEGQNRRTMEQQIRRKSLDYKENSNKRRAYQKERRAHSLSEVGDKEMREEEELEEEEDEEEVLGEVDTHMGKNKRERQKQKERKAQEKAEDELMDKIREQYWKSEVPDDLKEKQKVQERQEFRTEKELRKEQERLKALRLKQKQEDIAARKAMHKRTKTFPQGACQTNVDNRL